MGVRPRRRRDTVASNRDAGPPWSASCVTVALLLVGAGDHPLLNGRIRRRCRRTRQGLGAGWPRAGLPAAGRRSPARAIGQSLRLAPGASRMPATVLTVLQQDGTYPEPVRGNEPARRRAAGSVPAGLVVPHHIRRARRALHLPAELSGHQLPRRGVAQRCSSSPTARSWSGCTSAISSMSPIGSTDGPNTLAVKVDSERALQDVDGVELADSWYRLDQLELSRLSGPGGPGQQQLVRRRPQRRHLRNRSISSSSGAVDIGWPRGEHRTAAARDRFAPSLTVYVRRAQLLCAPESPGAWCGPPSRRARASRTSASSRRSHAGPGESREITFEPGRLPRRWSDRPPGPVVAIHRWASPTLYDLRTGVPQYNQCHRQQHAAVRHPLRRQHPRRRRAVPELRSGGNFYLKVNGRDFLVARRRLHP